MKFKKFYICQKKKNINLCFFNALYYLKYCINSNFYSNIGYFIDTEVEKYNKNKSEMFSNPDLNKSLITGSFCQFFFNNIKNKVKEFDKKYEKSKNPNETIEKIVSEKIEKNEKFEEKKDFKKYGNKIKNILAFFNENIKELKTLKESNINNFKDVFLFQINNCHKAMKNELKEKLNNAMSNLDMFFKADYQYKKRYK